MSTIKTGVGQKIIILFGILYRLSKIIIKTLEILRENRVNKSRFPRCCKIDSRYHD